MTKDEAWHEAVERHALGHVADNYCRRQVEMCVKQTATISQAIALAVFRGGCMLGWWGMSAPDLGSRCMGAFPRQPVHVWIAPKRWSRDDDPDLVITWREVFEYVRDGHRTVQLSMFEEVT